MHLSCRDRRGYLALALLVPMLAAPLGVDGGAIFQILAVENLGLDASQIGLAVGLGAVSIPVQVWAARIPLRSARRNLRLFISVMVGLCLALAGLLAWSLAANTTLVAVITIAVVAELAVSVLYATSWQPLLSVSVDPGFRQRLNAQVRAVGGVLMVGVVALIGWLGRDGRIMVVLAIAVVGLGLLPATRVLRSAELAATEPGGHEPGGHEPGSLESGGLEPAAQVRAATVEPPTDKAAGADGVAMLYVALGLSAIPAWPFAVTYAADVLWPTANLGLVGAAQVIGSLAVAAGWRPTDHGLLARARIGALVLAVCAVGLVAVGRPVEGGVTGLAVVAIVAVAAGAGATVRLALLEAAHRRSTEATSVRILTTLDVVGSTSMQLGFLVAGYLISRSVGWNGLIDPFQLSLLVGSAALLAVLSRLRI